MPISKVTLPDNSTQAIKDSRLPDADNNGKSLTVVDGEWAVGDGSGRWALDDGRIITSGTTCPLYRYKICGFGRHGRLVPLTITDQTTTTIVQKTPVSVGIDPQRGLVYYGGTTNYTSVNYAVGKLFPTSSRIDGRYTFNSAIAVRNEIYLKGTYSDHVFFLDTSNNTSWYVCADMAALSSTAYFSVFTSGSYYMLVGTTGYTANMIDLKESNPLFYFDGTYLIQVNLDSRIDTMIGDIETLINAL